MGCDFYTQEIFCVKMKTGEVIRDWEGNNSTPVERGWFPDCIFDGIDVDDYKNEEVKEEIKDAKDEYLESLQCKKIIWSEGQPLKSLCRRMLRDLELDESEVKEIYSRVDTWERD